MIIVLLFFNSLLLPSFVFALSPSPSPSPSPGLYFRSAGNSALLSTPSLLPVTSDTPFCPKSQLTRKFSVVCIPPQNPDLAVKNAVFHVNGNRVRRDRRPPFFITKVKKQKLIRWKSYPRLPFRLSCTLTFKDKSVQPVVYVVDDVYITCNKPTPTLPPSPSPSTSTSLQLNDEDRSLFLWFRPAFTPLSTSTTASRILIRDNMTFCPQSAFPTALFSIQCAVNSVASTQSFLHSPVTFQVNGVSTRIDFDAPFFIAGDEYNTRGDYYESYAWTDFPANTAFNLSCFSDLSVATVSNVTISCPPPKLQFVTLDLKKSVPVVDDLTFCPRRAFANLNDAFSVRCTDDSFYSSVSFSVNDTLVRMDNKAPFLISEAKDNGVPTSWLQFPKSLFNLSCTASPNGPQVNARRVRISCATDVDPIPTTSSSSSPSLIPESNSDGNSKNPADDPSETASSPIPSRSPAPAPLSKSDVGCIVFDAAATKTSPLPSGWTLHSDATSVGYFMNESGLTPRVTGGATSRLFYDVVPTYTSRYAIVLDMTTFAVANHNDVYVRVEGGFQLMRSSVVPEENEMKTHGWIKVWHNSKGRKAMISGGHPSHSVATKLIMKKGERFVFGLAGRSNVVLVHRVIMFPCHDTQCQRSSKRWKAALRICEQ